jgi:myo-inositol 2-dehydrogenase/D-chiro-inositol 1-dehydrogenase
VTPIGLGLIGCGSIARLAHLPAMSHLRGLVRLVAAADLDAAAADAAARPWDAAAETDYRAILARKDVTAVVIATPEFMHAEQVIAAAQAGKHVLCEKPMCRTLAEADAMLDACRRAGTKLMIGHSRRFTRRYLEIRRALDEGAIGEVRLLRENERRTSTRVAHIAHAGVRFTPRHWTGNPDLATGVALSHGIHEMDLLRWFAGAEPVSAYAEHAVTVEGNVGVPDFLSFVLRFANGAIGSAEISCHPPASYPAYHLLELYGTTGAIRARDHELIATTEYDATGAHFTGAYDALMHNANSYVRQLAAFIDAIRQDRDVAMPPTEARAALATALAVVQSARTGREVSLGPNTPAMNQNDSR